ncbi:MAG: DUF58 domain-containing protein [Anaerolineales bacterium]|nr:DUF58 domain-containing protein [Anaerolineales bacterium]
MSGFYLPFLIIILVIAALLRDDFALTLIYLFLGAFLLGTWWSRKSLHQIEHTREMNQRAFYGEAIQVRQRFRNTGWLPVVWMSIRDKLPVELGVPSTFKYIISLGSYEKKDFHYTLYARKRGYYTIGPLSLSTSDILGFNEPIEVHGQEQNLTVYPKIIPFSSLEIPSRSPQGTLRHTQPIFEDPTRILGKREYVAGDSLRSVDWKATAVTGNLQVKLFEPSIALETMAFLNLNSDDYPSRHQIDSIELAIVIAASLANWVIGKKQTFGIRINGTDPFTANETSQTIPPRKGQAHLIRILETLARIQKTEKSSLNKLIQEQRYHLGWGTTLLVITGQVTDELIDELYQARRSGQNVVMILAGPVANVDDIRNRAEHFGISTVAIQNERAMDTWRL